jgi:hypothetical protein
MNGTTKRGAARADRARETSERLAHATDARLKDLDEATDDEELAVAAAVAAKAVRASIADSDSVPPIKGKGKLGKILGILTAIGTIAALINELLK